MIVAGITMKEKSPDTLHDRIHRDTMKLPILFNLRRKFSRYVEVQRFVRTKSLISFCCGTYEWKKRTLIYLFEIICPIFPFSFFFNPLNETDIILIDVLLDSRNCFAGNKQFVNLQEVLHQNDSRPSIKQNMM